MNTRIRTAYSFRNAAGRIEDVMARLKEVGATVAPISDTASTFGWVKWDALAKKNDLRPVFGIELGVTPSPNAKRPTVDHWTFFARRSLEPLHDLLELATQQFRYQPLLTYHQALDAKGVTIITGHRPLLAELRKRKNLYLSLSPSTPVGLSRKAHAKGYKFIAASDNRYPTIDEQAFYEVVCGRNAHTQSYPQHILTKEEWIIATKRHGVMTCATAMKHAQDFPDWHKAKLKPAKMLIPERPKTLIAMCREGAQRVGIDLKDPVYKARLKRELDLLKAKGFEDYFYIIADMLQWARARMPVGPARGSSSGSLVCNLLHITTIDPIPWGLLFERFVDENRDDLPDIDIDFSDTQRQAVFDYMAEKYGQDRVARLGTVALYRPTSSLNEAGAALNIPPWEIRPVVESLIQRSSGDARALQTLEDTFTDTPAGQAAIAKHPGLAVTYKMEGHPRHHSQHAAGIIVTEEPVKKYVAVDARTGATHCDKKDAEKLNMLKIDALGLTQLSVFEQCLSDLGLPHDHLDTIPLDDPKAFEVLNSRHYAGIFQFNGLALQSLAKQIQFDHIEDIVSITALARPGPLASGGANEWVRRRIGSSPVTYPHPLFEPYLKNSLGIVIYQEQVMSIGKDIGGLSWGDVGALRQAMSKSLGAEYFDKYGDPWKKGAKEKGIPDDVLNKVWSDLCAYGSWSFNRSHSVAYGIISYWCAYLKAHHPMEFAAATLTREADADKQLLVLRELAAEGIEYVPVDADTSIDRWVTAEVRGERRLVGPLQGVRGIGPKGLQQALSARARGEPLPSRVAKALENPVTPVDELYPVTAAFARILPDPSVKNIYSTPLKLVDVEPNGDWQEDVLVFVVLRKAHPRDENDDAKVADRGHKLDGPTWALNMNIADDTDTMLAKIGRWDYQRWGKPVINRGKIDKALYAMKGTVLPDFRMLLVKQVRYIGDITDAE